MTVNRVVDAHAHTWLPEVEQLVEGTIGKRRELDELARRMGAESLRVTLEMTHRAHQALTDLETRLELMDKASVDVQLVSPNPVQYYYWAEPALAQEMFVATNESVAALCAQAPDRLTGLGMIPLQHPDLAVEALDHAVLTCGLKGVEISSFAPHGDGRVELSALELGPLWARAEELEALIFLHPLGCTVEGRLDRWHLDNVIGQPLEHTIALSHLIFGGVLDRHPQLHLLAAHGGGYLPAYLGRADHAWSERADAHSCERPPSEYLRRLSFDSLVYTPQALRHLVDTVGPRQVLLGTDYPYDMGITDPLDRLAAAGLATGAAELIAGGNAARLGLSS